MSFLPRNPLPIAIVAGLVAIALAASAPAATAPEPSKQEIEGIIFARQQTMLQLNRDGELLGQIVAGLAPGAKLAETTRAIAKGAHDAVEDFRDMRPGGRAKPEVWSNNADFTQRMEAFARNADAMARAGETGNVGAVTALMIDAMPCKQCHDLYREPKKP